jgi:hypothetical protein
MDGPATTPVPILKKRRGIATRHSNPQNVDDSTRYIKNFESAETKENVVDLSRSNKNGQFEAQNKVLVAADINPSSAATAIANQSWWESPEAHVLFCDVKRSAGDNGNLLSPREYVETRIERLKQGFATAQGWKLVVQDFDARDLCTPNDIFIVQM